jgi:large subunit ribosomal protein L10
MTTTPHVRPSKDEQIAFIRERFSKATSAVFLDPRNIDVETITALRARFREKGVEYRVVKNTLVHKAITGTTYEKVKLDSFLVGMTGIAWSYEDPSIAAKILKAFRKENEKNEKVTIKGGVLESTVFNGAKVESDLAAVPGKDEMRAMFLATLQAPAQAVVRQLMAPLTSLVYALDARKRQLEAT